MTGTWSDLKARVPYRYKYVWWTALALARTGRPIQPETWAIGLYGGPSPFELAPLVDGPVLTAGQVSGVKASFVADPFMIRVGEQWHLFCEVWNHREGRGEIAHAVSRDARRWDYRGVVLAEPFHLSYPYVFACEGEHYLIPESGQDRSVRLYRGDPFPQRWTHCAILLEGHEFRDASLVGHRGIWWMFVETGPGNACDTLRLYSAEHLTGPWREHPASPVVQGDRTAARPAGRVLSHAGHVVRFAQDCAVEYGTAVHAFRVTTLTEHEYAEQRIGPVLGPGSAGWNREGMHHVDPHECPDGRWIACVDGRS